MSKKKPYRSDLELVSPIIMIPLIVYLMLGPIGLEEYQKEREQKKKETGTYVVSAKGANRIEYYSIDNAANTHVMKFDRDTVFELGGFYPCINVGDTIVGRASFMNKPVNNSWYWGFVGGEHRFPVRTISTVNGRGFKKALRHAARQQRNARFDSIMRQAKQKQR